MRNKSLIHTKDVKTQEGTPLHLEYYLLNDSLLDGCADPYNPKTVRASMGAVFRTQPVRMTRQQAIAACRDAGIPLLATAMSADAVDLRQAELHSAAVIIGSEGQGICQELFDAAQGKIIIPMSPRCESLNAAVAAAIVLWQMKR